MKILITGASGFLGKNLTEFLIDKGHTITVLGRDEGKLKNVFFGRPVIIKITDYSLESLKSLTQDQEIIIHLASKLMNRETHPLKISDFQDNIQIVENLIIACSENNVKKFINTSSISVYPRKNQVHEKQESLPWNIYGVSKANVDIYLNYIKNKVQTHIVSLRLARLYGYGEREGLVFTDFVSKALNKETLTISGEGKSTIEYIYIKDVVDAIYAFIEDNKCQGIYNVGSGKAFTILEIATSINEVFENQENIQFVNDCKEEIMGSVMDITKIKSDLNWAPQWNLTKSLNDIKIKIKNEKK